MREIAAAGFLLLALVIGALAPQIWAEDPQGAALASGRPSASATPKQSPAAPKSPLVPIFPQTDRPVELTLRQVCAIETASLHNDDLGMTWRVQCGSATANREVAPAAIAQGWRLSEGNPPIGVGIQNYSKSGLWMQIAYRLDGPAFADPFVIVQALRSGVGTYDSSPHEFSPGPWCGIVDQPSRSADACRSGGWRGAATLIRRSSRSTV
jgi:hypothetical protein